ncbi:Translation initiation factor 2, alpha subunit [Sesbania bispinosa]|nr:Translation initiation factor 2, alpha subunit [Sesbania bispinosa]
MAPNLECRMYEAKYPEVDMAVMIQVKNIADMGAYVSLLEYNNIEGMILFSELSRRRIRSVSSLIKVGRIEPVMVLRVDKEKGYIDLSKRRVSEEDIQACEERSCMFILDGLYIANMVMLLSALTREVKEVGPDGQEVTKVVPAVSEEVKDALEAMRKAEAAGNDDCPVKIKLVAPPLYVLTTQTLDKEQGILVLNNAIVSCTESIEQHKGKLVVKEAPRAVSERDDKLLAEHMAKLRQDNEEVSGDEDSEEEEDTGMGEVDVENNGSGIME